jgi:dTDP-4-dehydrorhamnose reductase
MKYVVIGADSLLGTALLKKIKKNEFECYGTTRRIETISPQRFYLDFQEPKSYAIPFSDFHAFIVAAATNYERCESDPNSKKVNVDLIPQLVESLIHQGAYVTLISTNSVFGGDRPWPDEDDPHDARIAYSIQKHESEARSFEIAKSCGALHRFNVVRLTKILSCDTSPLPSWLNSWKNGEVIEPFADLVFAPISLKFICDSLLRISLLKTPGCLHLSGSANISYVEFAYALADAIGVNRSLIVPSSASEKGINILFKPRFSGLGMNKTTQITGIFPQSIREVIADLINEENYRLV